MTRALAILAVIATPALAQDPDLPPFDGTRIDACLQAAEQGGDPDAAQGCIGAASGPCMDSDLGASTYAMSYCLDQERMVWDDRLNASYDRVMTLARAADARMAELGSAAEKRAPLLQQMQRDWIRFRDAACAFERSGWGGGTGSGPATLQCQMELTAQQYLRLRPHEFPDG